MDTRQKCLVTGAGGYLGGRVTTALQQRGWQVVELTRNPGPGSPAVRFRLGEAVPPAALAGAQALIHCAYDFRQLTRADIHRVNVAGTEKILRAAREAGVANLIYISTISAFEGCRSLYGKAKCDTEKIARSLGAMVIRPGLVFGEPPGAMFGRLIRQVGHSRVLPLVGGGSQIQYLVHEQDLSNFICRCAEGNVSAPDAPITIAHEQPWTLRQILEEIARAKGKSITFVPVPWRLVWAGIKCGELCGLKLSFQSDSLASLMHQNPNPAFAPQRELKIACRPFKMETVESSKS